MMLNCEKSNYMLFTRSKSNFSTRLKLNSSNLQKVESMKLLGVWIPKNLDWETNTREICKKSYSVNLSLSFAKKCLKYQRHSTLFPVEPVTHNHQLRNVELFTVNYARTEKYRKSAIPYMQRKLNFL